MEQDTSIGERVERTIDELGEVALPGPPPVHLIGQLDQLPRSGKLVRIEKYALGLPVQSVGDHVRALGSLADVLQDQADLSDTDEALLADCIVFHDFAEVLTGDPPDYTPETLTAGILVAGALESETEANAVIASALPTEMRQRFEASIQVLENSENPVTEFFQMVDKAEPILSIWRYLHAFHDRIEIDRFIEAMDDFFTNPRTLQKSISAQVTEALIFFLSADNARSYYANGIDGLHLEPSSLGHTLLSRFIEHVPMRFIRTKVG